MHENESQIETPAPDFSGLSIFCQVNADKGSGWGVFVATKMDGEDGEEEAGTYTFIASEPKVDRHNDVVDSSWRLDNFTANPVILWGHDSSAPPIGRGEVYVNDAGQLLLSVTFDTSELNPAGRLAEHQVRNGFLKAVSVGFIAHTATHRSDLAEDHPAAGERGYLLGNNELLEVSLVSIPALPSALHVNSASLPDVRSVTDLQRVLRNVEAGQLGAIVKEAPATGGLLEASAREVRHLANLLQVPDLRERMAVLEAQLSALVEERAAEPTEDPDPLKEFQGDWWKGWREGK